MSDRGLQDGGWKSRDRAEGRPLARRCAASRRAKRAGLQSGSLARSLAGSPGSLVGWQAFVRFVVRFGLLAGRATALLAVLALVACGRTQPRPHSTTEQTPAGPGEVGIASHYHARFAGRKTASGEPYRPNAMTAAHLKLPMGTVVRVTRIDKRGRHVAGPIQVVINDRGPYAKGRIIDLSEVAARRLGLYNDIARVRVEVVSLPASRR